MEPWITAGATLAGTVIGSVVTLWTQAADATDRRRERLREALGEARMVLVDAVPTDDEASILSTDLLGRWQVTRPKLATAIIETDGDLRDALAVVVSQTNSTLLHVAALADADGDYWHIVRKLSIHHQLRGTDAVSRAAELIRPRSRFGKRRRPRGG